MRADKKHALVCSCLAKKVLIGKYIYSYVRTERLDSQQQIICNVHVVAKSQLWSTRQVTVTHTIYMFLVDFKLTSISIGMIHKLLADLFINRNFTLI